MVFDTNSKPCILLFVIFNFNILHNILIEFKFGFIYCCSYRKQFLYVILDMLVQCTFRHQIHLLQKRRMFCCIQQKKGLTIVIIISLFLLYPIHVYSGKRIICLVVVVCSSSFTHKWSHSAFREVKYSKHGYPNIIKIIVFLRMTMICKRDGQLLYSSEMFRKLYFSMKQTYCRVCHVILQY